MKLHGQFIRPLREMLHGRYVEKKATALALKGDVLGALDVWRKDLAS